MVKAKSPPISLGARIDAHWRLYRRRKLAELELNKIKQDEEESAKALLDEFSHEQLKGARGKLAQCSVSRREFVEIKDYPKLCAFIKRHNAFDLLHRRVSIEALRQRLEAEESVPGVAIGANNVLSLTTLKGA